MRLELAFETSVGAEGKVNALVEVSHGLSAFFCDRDYGDGLKRIVIGVITVAPEFELFSKARRPKYVFQRRYVKDDIEFVEDRVFTFDLKLDYLSLISQPDNENCKMLARGLAASTKNFFYLPKRAVNFDKVLFERDLKGFLKQNQLLE